MVVDPGAVQHLILDVDHQHVADNQLGSARRPDLDDLAYLALEVRQRLRDQGSILFPSTAVSPAIGELVVIGVERP